MDEQELLTKPEKFSYQTILRYFIQGIIVLAPITITGYLLYWLFDKIDSILRPYINIPGIGFAIIILFVVLVGWASSKLILSGIFNIFDHWLERTPGVKFIYTSTKDFFSAFAGEKKKFDKAVLVNTFADDVWIVGFLTDEELHNFNVGAEVVSVYVPQAYNFAGQLYIVPRYRIRKMENISPGVAMKYAVTGGVAHLVEEKLKH
ncbi:MAG: DUF502 domain-containing protein [Chitinophagaceae bacterium]|nr:DUF502 domain-containing protein [Chitinophagaceae bacterium]